MNLRSTRGRDDPEINFIPLIDVLLVILIFLMVTTTYQRFAELQITLPEADAEQLKQRPKEINVGIDAQGRYVVDKTAFAFSSVPALADALRARRRRRQGPGGRDQRGRQRDASVRDPRHGSRARRRLRSTSRSRRKRRSSSVGPRSRCARDAPCRRFRCPRLPPRRCLVRSTLTALTAPLVPFAAAFARARSRAARAFPAGLCCTRSGLPVPVIVVGNITVGGSGKTPLVAALARALAERGWHPGIVSRGHGDRARGGSPIVVAPDSRCARASATSRCCSRAPAFPSSWPARSGRRRARADRRRIRDATSSSATTDCSITASRATSRSSSSTRARRSATAGGCPPDRCASPLRASTKPTRSSPRSRTGAPAPWSVPNACSR